MVAEFTKHSKALVNKELLFLSIIVFLVSSADSPPERKLRFHIDTQHVSRDKCSFGRAASVEAVVIDAERAGYLHYAQPLVNITWSKACFWEDKTIMLSAQESLSAVYSELSAVSPELTDAEDMSALIAVNVDAKFIKNRVKLAPKSAFS